jgi:hypothetical protein
MVFAIIARINDGRQPQYTVAGAIGPSPEYLQRLWAPLWLGPPGVRASPPDRSRPAAGSQAMAVANSCRALIFPKASGNALSPAPPHRRQDNIFDTQNGSFSNHPLGLWRLTFGLADAFPQALEANDTPGIAASVTLRPGGFSRMTESHLTARGRSSSGFFLPRFQGWNITTQGGPQQ